MTNDQTCAEAREEARGHYRSAGTGLVLLGLINTVVAGTSVFMDSANAYIGYDMMFTFGFGFIAVGVWMRSYKPTD